MALSKQGHEAILITMVWNPGPTLGYNGSISFENVAGEQEASQDKQLIFSYHLLGPPPCDG